MKGVPIGPRVVSMEHHGSLSTLRVIVMDHKLLLTPFSLRFLVFLRTVEKHRFLFVQPLLLSLFYIRPIQTKFVSSILLSILTWIIEVWPDQIDVHFLADWSVALLIFNAGRVAIVTFFLKNLTVLRTFFFKLWTDYVCCIDSTQHEWQNRVTGLDQYPYDHNWSKEIHATCLGSWWRHCVPNVILLS